MIPQMFRHGTPLKQYLSDLGIKGIPKLIRWFTRQCSKTRFKRKTIVFIHDLWNATTFWLFTSSVLLMILGGLFKSFTVFAVSIIPSLLFSLLMIPAMVSWLLLGDCPLTILEKKAIR